MANIRNNTMSPQAARSGESAREVRERWAGEIHTEGTGTAGPGWNEPWADAESRRGTEPATLGNETPMRRSGQPDMPEGGMQMRQGGQYPANDGLKIRSQLPAEVIESPVSMNEAYLGSLKAMLLRNKGNYIVATFLVGTQNTVSWEGVLYDVGNDYVTIYQQGRDRYIVSDIYSLRYMEFYDTRQRELCDRLLQQNGMWERP